MSKPSRITSFKGASEAAQSIRDLISRVANSTATVLITGESGTGKELVARALHDESNRAGANFVPINCTAIPKELIESELFGHRKGAFTGAMNDRIGRFELAHGGTIFLDEIGDLSMDMQVKLLRAIQERRVRKLGAQREDVIDVRILSATHQNLASLVERGSFRQDLYFRLQVIALSLPPLRARREDIPLLCDAILRRHLPLIRKPVISAAAMDRLVAYDFPGNVRELENVLERALAFSVGTVIEPDDLYFESLIRHGVVDDASRGETMISTEARPASMDSLRTSLPVSLPVHLAGIERELIQRALGQSRFNRTRAASLLGISLRQLRYRMQRLTIHDAD
jgi:two-component system response regulator PilR (NtrC family)